MYKDSLIEFLCKSFVFKFSRAVVYFEAAPLLQELVLIDLCFEAL